MLKTRHVLIYFAELGLKCAGALTWKNLVKDKGEFKNWEGGGRNKGSQIK